MKSIKKKYNYPIWIIGISVISAIFTYNANPVKASQELEDQEKVLLGDVKEQGDYSEAFPLPQLTGNWREDIIAIAESQLGYEEAADGSTLFGAWAGDAKQAWCSEFTSWCAYQAGVPETIFPKKRSSRGFYKYYSEIGRFYFLEGGISPKVSGYGSSYAETISLEELEPGDIILKETNGDYSNGADHTGLFVAIKNGEILYISGNSNDSVEEKICPIEDIHGICKPDYNMASAGWQSKGGKWYYFDQKSGNQKTGWQYIDKKWYYLDEVNGDMKIGWQYLNGKWYYLDEVNGDMKVEWQYINGKWYYFDMQSGACLIDTVTPDGYRVDENGAWVF